MWQHTAVMAAYDLIFLFVEIIVYKHFPFVFGIPAVAIALLWFGFRMKVSFIGTGIPHAIPKPFLGNIVEWGKKNYLVATREWAQKYGHIFGIHLGRSPVVVVADAKVFEQLHIKQSAVLYDRPKLFVCTVK